LNAPPYQIVQPVTGNRPHGPLDFLLNPGLGMLIFYVLATLAVLIPKLAAIDVDKPPRWLQIPLWSIAIGYLLLLAFRHTDD
jgi:hypothetical protein